MTLTYWHADPRDVLGTLPAASVACVVTSPPYLRRRNYGVGPREIGAGTLDEYLDDLRAVMADVRRVLRPDGLAWLNVGDTAVGTGGSGGDYAKGGGYEGRATFRANAATWVHDGRRISGGQWGLVPYRLADALGRDGWRLRSMIVWNKIVVRREDKSHVKRPGEQHETILMLSRTAPKGYRYFPEREVEPGDVWSFMPSRGKSLGKAPFPLELPARCIAVSSEPGDTILDPFAGAFATGLAAHAAGRHAIGIDLDLDALTLATARCADVGVVLGRPRLPALIAHDAVPR